MADRPGTHNNPLPDDLLFTLVIRCEHDAFLPYPRAEVVRILHEAARRLEDRLSDDGRYAESILMDVNGAVVGEFKLARMDER